jgi:hypothetical protein
MNPKLNWTIQQTTVSTLTEYLDLVRRYRQLVADTDNVVLLFRGQTRDHLHSIGQLGNLLPAAFRGQLSLLPAAFRTTASYLDWSTDSQQLRDAVIPWFNCLADIGIVPRVRDPRHTARVIRTPEILAVLKHYGFSTPSLDVTSNPLVALWFATNRAHKDPDGVWHFTALSTSTDTSNPVALPSVYIFLQWSFLETCPVVDLTGLQKLHGHASRPFAQSAVALPVDWHLSSPSFLRDPPEFEWTPLHLLTSRQFRYPSAVIKILFGAEDLRDHSPALCQSTLFPLDDPIYNALLRMKAPHLVIYGDNGIQYTAA